MDLDKALSGSSGIQEDIRSRQWSEDCTVWMWNADKGFLLNIFKGHGGSVTRGDFTPYGKLICTGSDDATLRIWDPKSGGNIHAVRGHPYHTRRIDMLGHKLESSLALTGSKDSSVHVVNISSGKVVSSLTSHSDSVECVAFSHSGPWAATGSIDQTLVVWDLQHSAIRSTCEHEDGVTCLSWLGTSRYLATGCVDGKNEHYVIEHYVIEPQIEVSRLHKVEVQSVSEVEESIIGIEGQHRYHAMLYLTPDRGGRNLLVLTGACRAPDGHMSGACWEAPDVSSAPQGSILGYSFYGLNMQLKDHICR
ncbi:hypothetical protein Dimus_036535 [Dionaea muscipula]